MENKKNPRNLGHAIQELLSDFLDEKVAQSTIRSYRRAITRLLDGTVRLGQLRRIGIDDLVAYRKRLLASGLSRNTVNVDLTAIREFFKYLRSIGGVARNPADRDVFKSLRVSRQSRTHGLSGGDIRRILGTCTRRTPKDRRDRAVLLCGILGGLRRSEIAGLKVQSIQRSGPAWLLELENTKGSDHETIKLDERVRRALVGWLSCRQKIQGRRANPEEPIFISLAHGPSAGRPLSAGAINDIVKSRARRANLAKKVTAHSLRHTCATLAINARAPVIKVQRHLRHKDPKTTMRYYRDYDNLRRAACDYVRW
jgi:integrase